MSHYYWRPGRPTPKQIALHAMAHPAPRRPGTGWWQRRTYDGSAVIIYGDENGLWDDRERVDSAYAGEEWRPVNGESDGVAWPFDADVSIDPTEMPDEVVNRFLRVVDEIELPGEAVAVWMKFRAELAPLPIGARNAAWRALAARTEEVGRMRNAKVWLKKAIAEEDARRITRGGAA